MTTYDATADETFWPIDLGSGWRARMMLSGDLLTSHRAPDGSPCGGFVKLTGHHAPHEVTGYPITIVPNVTCQTCHQSGWIRDGRWVPL